MEYVYLVFGEWEYEGASISSLEVFSNIENAERYADKLRKEFIYDSVVVSRKEVL